ncbi:uncharacterized protein LOC135844736 [Planococcus citri]|uniref:uncharacterized protein LOC135844736 n=1 Tax=Planococcus citri TaxID=170843 RepID=UPI0031F73A8B
MASINPLVFHSSPPSLKKITSISITKHLWKDKIIDGSFERTFFDKPSPFKFDNRLPIPQMLADSIDQDIVAIRSQLKKWLHYIRCRIFCWQSIVFDVLKKYFDRLIWNIDGTINDISTARDMLTWPRLSPLNKYRIACVYCLAENVREIRSTLPPEIFWARYSYDEDPMLYYWEQSLRGSRDARLEPSSIVKNHQVDRWSAIEYFFNQARQPDQQRLVISTIISHKSCFYTRKLLPLLDQTRLEYVICEFGCDIMIDLLCCPDSQHIALETWTYVKDRINKAHFEELIRWVLTFEAEYKQPMDEELVSTSIEIWNRCPPRLKQSCLRDILNDSELFDYYGSNFRKLPRDLRFIKRIISDASRQMRNEFWKKNWNLLIRGSRPIYLKDLMEMCMDPKEIDHFKEHTMGEFEFIREYCLELIKKRCYYELDDYLTFCYKERKKNLDVQRRVVEYYFPRKKPKCPEEEWREYQAECIRKLDIGISEFREFRNRVNANRRNNRFRPRRLIRFLRMIFTGCIFS